MQRMTSPKIDVLIVDDQIGVRSLLALVLSEAGYNVSTAANGLEAVQMVNQYEPALVLMDLKMPVMDGMQALEEIRAKYYNIPIIIMTAYGDEETIRQLNRMEAVYYISKPFDVNQITSIVGNLLNNNNENKLCL